MVLFPGGLICEPLLHLVLYYQGYKSAIFSIICKPMWTHITHMQLSHGQIVVGFKIQC